MASTGYRSTSSSPTITNAIRIDGAWRDISEARIIEVRLTSGASEASTAVISFPNETYGRQPVSLGDTVQIYLDIERNGTANPIFSGYVFSEDDDYSDAMRTAYQCVDLRRRMGEAVCRRNFNQRDSRTGLPRERLSFAQIAQQIVRDFNTDASFTLTARIDTSALSNDEAPPQYAMGLSCAAMLDSLLMEGSALENAWWAVSYTSTSMLLKAYSPESGARRLVNFGSDTSLSFKAQRANAEQISTVTSDENLVNRVIALGGFDIIQHAFPLEADWPDSIAGIDEADIMENWDIYTKRYLDSSLVQDGAARIQNDLYLPGAAAVGTRYLIPQLELYDETTNLAQGEVGSTSAQHPELLNRLIDENERPFIVYTLPDDDEGVYRLKQDGFTIKDRVVSFSEPFLVKQTDVTYGTPEEIESSLLIVQWEDGFAYSFEKEGVTENALAGHEIHVAYTKANKTGGVTFGVKDISLDTTGAYLDIDCARPSGTEWEAVTTSYYLDVGEPISATMAAIVAIAAVDASTVRIRIGYPSGVAFEDVFSWINKTKYNPQATVTAYSTPTEITNINKMVITSNEATDGGFVVCHVAAPIRDFFGNAFLTPEWEEENTAAWTATYMPKASITETWYQPDNVWLVACYRDTTRLIYDTGKLGSESDTITERVVMDDFKREYYAKDCFIKKGDQISGKTAAKTAARNDTAALTSAAIKRVAGTMNRRPAATALMPFYPSEIRVGDRVSSRDVRLKNKNIGSVTFRVANESGDAVAMATLEIM